MKISNRTIKSSQRGEHHDNQARKKKKPGEKLNNISPEYDSVREQNVLLEDIKRDVKAIAEGHISLDRKLDDANVKFGQRWS